MPEALKNLYFTPDSIRHLAGCVAAEYPAFDRDRFLALVYTKGWDALELKDRMHHVARCLHATLPAGYADAIAILRRVIPHISGFDVMSFPDFVELYGQDDWDLSMETLAEFTRYASGEFAVRPFLHRDPERALRSLTLWAQSADPHLRRLASEGSRPRLPWAMALPAFKRDPRPLIPLLALLKDDESDTVRRSVANNLNDISKDHPELVLEIAEAWYGQSPRTDWILKHALRGLLKKGNPRALALFGFEHPESARVSNLRIDPDRLPIGESVTFTYDLIVEDEEPVSVRIEYAVDFVKARGNGRKVFKITEREFAPGTYPLRRRHSFADLSTRTHYPGEHRLTVIVNGHPQAEATVTLLAAPADPS